MYPAPIDVYVAPCTIDQAIGEKARLGDGSLFLAGGMSAMQAIKSRMLRPSALIDLNNVDELRGIRRDGAAVTIGGMTRYREIAESAELSGSLGALRDAASHVGDRQVRNRGTIGGSVCWNYVAACTPPVVLALAGNIELASAGLRRVVAARDFFLGPLETSREDDELLTAISFEAPPHSGSAYKKWGLVTDALPVIGFAARVELAANGSIAAASIVLGGLSSGLVRLAEADLALVGMDPKDTDAVSAVLKSAALSVDAQDDLWATVDYRRMLIASLGVEVVAIAAQRARA